MKNDVRTFRIVLSSIFLVLAYVMPFLSWQIPEIGQMLCLMHIPVLLCGFICGWKYGLSVGFIAPLLRSFTLGAPILFPMAISMACELAVYGAVAGIIYKLLPEKKIYIYMSLIIAMISGRIVWGIAMFLCVAMTGGGFTLAAFVAGALTNAVPGIILQLVLVPVIVMAYEKIKTTGDKYENI